MTTGQIMMRLREIEANVDAAVKGFASWAQCGAADLRTAQLNLQDLIKQMLEDDRRALAARTMGELPYDGQRVKE